MRRTTNKSQTRKNPIIYQSQKMPIEQGINLRYNVLMVKPQQNNANTQLHAQLFAKLFPEKFIYFSFAGIVIPIMIFVPKYLISTTIAGSSFAEDFANTTTPILDIITNVIQAIMIICLCFSHNRYARVNKRSYITVAFYYISAYIFWTIHLINYKVPVFIVVVKYLLPCLAVYFYACDNPNKVAKGIIIIFAILHLASGILNYIVDLQTIISFFH